MVESSPATSLCTDYNSQLLAAGIARYADRYGTHAYGGQICPGDDCFRKLRDKMTQAGTDLPIAISQAGSAVS